MREIRTSGSEGGGIETNRCSLPLSVTTGRQGLLDCPVKPGNDTDRVNSYVKRAYVSADVGRPYSGKIDRR